MDLSANETDFGVEGFNDPVFFGVTPTSVSSGSAKDTDLKLTEVIAATDAYQF
ncbi:hypothetical protein DPMN_126800 [Dreissena polymorpha]|uniref:Uncharacterized protein n=1 Tax=Dreissena polymorpha TaxID=45954 RepID=A0A9D4H048_DREPO|nr:hypothetical protein DPMN_126800 [Dreissena polymorpha]